MSGGNRMDEAERAEWLSHTEEWARELRDEASGYALDCRHNGGSMAELADQFLEVAEVAEHALRKIKGVTA